MAFAEAGFAAAVTLAPDDDATISGIVTLEVHGSALGNVELLPATGYIPKWGIFTISADRTVAQLNFDSRVLPNGPIQLRISAFDRPAGDPTASEIVAMPVRTWNISNPPSVPAPAPFTAAVILAPADGATIGSTVTLEVHGSALANVELLPAAGYTPKWGVFTISPDQTVARLDFDTRALPNGPVQLRISAFDRPAGDPTASEIVAMPTRTWNISNPAPAPFTAALTLAPAESATISGIVTLEVRGTSLGNVELLPPTGYVPKWGIFTISPDRTVARLDFDTSVLPSGLTQLRISAFNLPAGDPTASEIVAMPPRTWVVINPPATPPVLVSIQDLKYHDPTPLQDLMALSDADYQNQLTNNWPFVESVLHLYIPANVDFVPLTPLGFYGPWSSCIRDHGLLACREHMAQLISLMNSKRPGLS